MTCDPDFRRATNYLVSVGEELALIRQLLNDIHGVHGVPVASALLSARAARASATRLANNFRSIAYRLEAIFEAERA